MTKAARPDSNRNFRVAFALLAIAALAWIGVTPFGGWVQSFFFGTGVRWENAYIALDTAEANLPRNEHDRERLLLANAMADGEPPVGLKLGPRLHPAGTLAHLRYETFDENNEPLNTWEVRALVPNIGNGVGPFWREPCARACRDEIARGSGTRILRSGEPGMAEEFVLRMPVGQTFSLKPRPLQMQDILDTRVRSVPLRSVQVADRSVPVPSKVLVTLVKACAGDVRAGTAMNLKFAENATVPVPLGFTVSHWAQLDGCGKLEPFEPPPREIPPVARRIRIEPPDLHAIVAYRDNRTGTAALVVDEAWLKQYGEPVLFHLNLVCRYDAAADQWRLLPRPDPPLSWRLDPLSAAEAAAGNRKAYELPKDTGLFWLHWSEQNDASVDRRSTVYRHSFAVSGPVLCNDVMMGEPPKGRVAACVPFDDRAEARFVPEPASCRSP